MLGQSTGEVHRLLHFYTNSLPFTRFLAARRALPDTPVKYSIIVTSGMRISALQLP